ncbi:tripartite tricarboxylate transporter substrate binding protein [Pigmentiphaga sp. NML080357]|uniref:Bug family tripartite tricarboxylate transporter substrate binding protein n=1 Tax=Pigmentiphaga sp. NML080357 TaxID=2008675 RepID=UPI001E4F3C8C|nr:tripartite tricarboxylate transporter substrate binding protein [Pigmentiphaga sp. NML080357]
MIKHLAAAMLVVPMLAVPAHAQWPERPVRIIAPFAPASTPDTLARVLSERLSKQLKQTFIVENKAGAGGMIGTDHVAKAAPDGYTLGVSITGPLVNNKLLYKKMPYDPDRDLTPITVAVMQPSVIVTRGNLDAANLEQLIAQLKQSPGKFNYASIGNGSLSHLTMELVASRSGTNIVHVPYGGSSQAVTALIAGDVDMACLPAAAVQSFVKAGKLRAIAVTTGSRTRFMPDVPTLAEQGMAGIDTGAWMGIVAPAGMDEALKRRIHQEVVRALRDPEARKAFDTQMMEVVAGTPAEFSAYLKEEADRWFPVIRKNKIELD